MDAFRTKVHKWANQERDRINEMRAFFDQPIGEGEFDFKKFQENRNKNKESENSTNKKKSEETKACR